MNPSAMETPAEVQQVLSRLRQRIRRYLLLEGTALVVAVVGILFWTSFGLDWLWFRLSRLELPVWFRTAFDVLALCVLAVLVVGALGLRLFRRLGRRALALVLERRFPELDDRLITAVEQAEKVRSAPPLTAAMLQRTVEDAARLSRNLELGAVFDRRPLRRSLLSAVALAVSILALWLTNAEAMSRWKQAYIDRLESYWDRHTELVLKVIAQPGDRIRHFDSQQEYKHPRAADLNLIVEVPEGRVVPETVELRYRFLGGGSKGWETLSADGSGRFRKTIVSLQDGIEIHLRGGDFATRRPYRVLVVDPPRVDRVVLHCDYPDYTGLDGIEDEVHKTVLGTQVALPLGTRFTLEADANKPLVGVRVQSDNDLFELHVAGDEDGLQGVLTVADSQGRLVRKQLPRELLDRFVSLKGSTFRTEWTLPRDAQTLWEQQGIDTSWPLPFPPDSRLRIYLEDIDGITSLDPTTLTINGKVDEPPVVETALRGIGRQVTPQAHIPVSGTISDDYGIAEAQFEFAIGDEPEKWHTRRFRRPPQDHPRVHRLKQSDDDETPVEVFEVAPLKMQVGERLFLRVYAKDTDALYGPNQMRGERYRFEIVSNEDLLQLIYGKELNLRLRFERIMQEVRQTREDLILHRGRYLEGQSLRNDPPADKSADEIRRELEVIDLALPACAERSLHGIRKNANETAAIEQEFRDLREEVINNDIPLTGPMIRRLGEGIITPLHRINEFDYPEADRALGRIRTVLAQNGDPLAAIDASVREIDELLDAMSRILDEMEEMIKFLKVVEELQSIIEEQKRVYEETREERKRKLFGPLPKNNP